MNQFSTGWPKSNVSKVRAYCSASDHLIRKIFSGVCRVSHWFEENLTRIAPALLGLRLALKISIYDYLPKFPQINVELFLNCYDLIISQ